MKRKTDEACWTCAYSYYVRPDLFCRRFPPKSDVSISSSDGLLKVYDVFWCGEFEKFTND